MIALALILGVIGAALFIAGFVRLVANVLEERRWMDPPS